MRLTAELASVRQKLSALRNAYVDNCSEPRLHTNSHASNRFHGADERSVNLVEGRSNASNTRRNSRRIGNDHKCCNEISLRNEKAVMSMVRRSKRTRSRSPSGSPGCDKRISPTVCADVHLRDNFASLPIDTLSHGKHLNLAKKRYHAPNQSCCGGSKVNEGSLFEVGSIGSENSHLICDFKAKSTALW